MLDNSHRKRLSLANDSRQRFSGADMVQRIVGSLPEPREVFWPAFKRCVSSNPQSARWIVALTALYLHLGPFSRFVIGQIEKKIADLGTGALDPRSKDNPISRISPGLMQARSAAGSAGVNGS